MSANQLNYTDFCKQDNEIIHTESDCNVTYTESNIELKCSYIDSESENNENKVYDISFNRHEEGSRNIDRIVSYSITSYPIPMKRSFILKNDDDDNSVDGYFSGDYYIGSITNTSNSLVIDILYDPIKHYSIFIIIIIYR